MFNFQGNVERDSIATVDSVIPVVVLPLLQEGDLSRTAIQAILERAQESDDVLNDGFCTRAVFQVPPDSSVLTYAHRLSSLELFEALFHFKSGSITATDRPAPYFLHGSNLLYEDRFDAFVTSIVPKSVKQPPR